MAPQLRRWLDWKGTPAVSIAVSLNKGTALAGRLYNFLPMSEIATAPLMGYLDAPFFTDIDRRSADLKLPLNETFLEAAAEACAAAAIWIVEQQVDVPPHAVFDLVAWTGEHASKLDVALHDVGTSLRQGSCHSSSCCRRAEWMEQLVCNQLVAIRPLHSSEGKGCGAPHWHTAGIAGPW